MRTARSRSHQGGLHQAPPQDQTPREEAAPWEQTLPGAGPPRSRHPQDQAPLWTDTHL